jgi:tRNA-binding EMAP/Myf-like protein
LANNWGNLVSRVSKLAQGMVLSNSTIVNIDEYSQKIDTFKFEEAISLIFARIDNANAKLNQETPWKLDKGDAKRVKVLQEIVSEILLINQHLRSIIPSSAEIIDGLFDKVVKPIEKPLFPRVDVPVTKTEQLINKIVTGKVVEIINLSDESIRQIGVDVGGKVLKVVCGDLSVSVGELVPVALPGARVNDKNGGKIKIKKGKVHGVESEAMLCSERELGKGEESTKIYRVDGEIGSEII